MADTTYFPTQAASKTTAATTISRGGWLKRLSLNMISELLARAFHIPAPLPPKDGWYM